MVITVALHSLYHLIGALYVIRSQIRTPATPCGERCSCLESPSKWTHLMHLSLTCSTPSYLHEECSCTQASSQQAQAPAVNRNTATGMFIPSAQSPACLATLLSIAASWSKQTVVLHQLLVRNIAAHNLAILRPRHISSLLGAIQVYFVVLGIDEEIGKGDALKPSCHRLPVLTSMRC